jgi:hypothetical protein
MSLNKVKNPDFSKGSNRPSQWAWVSQGKGLCSTRIEAVGGHRRGNGSGDGGIVKGVVIESDRTEGEGWYVQVITSKPDGWLRVDAVVECELEADDPAGGFTLAIQPLVEGEPSDEPRLTPPVLRSRGLVTVRAYYHVHLQVRRLQVSFGIRHARGRVKVREVRALAMIDPEEVSHPLAIPPPPWAVRPVKVVQRACVVSESASMRPITELLKDALGQSSVTSLAPSEFRPDRVSGDAVLLPDSAPPRAIRSLSGLLKLAEKRIVVISLPAFATLTRGALSMRRVEQLDDPTAARVVYSDYMTRGFALHDTFTYGATGCDGDRYIQNHYRKSTSAVAFLERHGFVALLESMCDQESTSNRPAALFRSTTSGGLFVYDIDPIESTASTMAESAPPMQLLLNMLGRSETGLGQYVVPFEKEAQLREAIREAAVRYRSFVVHDENVPSEEVTEQLVTIGHEDGAFGLPLRPKPLILVRSGLTSGDAESLYGSWFWFKQLIRMPPYACPYAEALGSRFRLAWVPCVAPWDSRNGWRRRNAPPRASLELELEGNSLAALIDVVSLPINRARIVLPASGDYYDRAVAWLSRLMAAFGANRAFVPMHDLGASFSDMGRLGWRFVDFEPDVVIEPDSFRDRVHRDAHDARADVIRLEVPGNDADFPALSIHRTHVVATLLEHVVGLLYGLIAVNRTIQPVHFDGFAPVSPGAALLVGREDVALRASSARVG